MKAHRLLQRLKPTLLDRYLLRQSLWLLLVTLGVGGGVYLMTDLFDRMDNFMEAGLELKYILIYFAVKLPFIIAQILPAAFLITVIIQLCFMAGSRELLALQAGGISLWRLTAFFIFFAVLWGTVQLFLSENLGVMGNNKANEIWNERVQNKPDKYNIVRNFWLMEDQHMIYAQFLNVEKGHGSGIVCYTLSDDGMLVEQVLRAAEFDMDGEIWTLHNATAYDTDGFVRENEITAHIRVKHSRSGLRMLGENVKLRDYSLWQIGRDIKRLEASGSNVEALRTGWHMKLAYASSLLVMSLVGVALITWKENLYINIGTGLLITFLFYTILTVGGTLGENGRIPPALAAWFPLFLVGGLALLKIWRKIPLTLEKKRCKSWQDNQ